jgi:hypothetical protein
MINHDGLQVDYMFRWKGWISRVVFLEIWQFLAHDGGTAASPDSSLEGGEDNEVQND